MDQALIVNSWPQNIRKRAVGEKPTSQYLRPPPLPRPCSERGDIRGGRAAARRERRGSASAGRPREQGRPEEGLGMRALCGTRHPAGQPTHTSSDQMVASSRDQGTRSTKVGTAKAQPG